MNGPKILWGNPYPVLTAYEVRLHLWTFTFTLWDCWVPEYERENVICTGVQFCKDDTPGCTAEACSFRDANREMQKRGIVVPGVSADSIQSHQKFTDKYGLPYPLLADTDTTVSQLYGVWQEKNYAGKTYMGINRETFLIDKEGIVRKIWPKVKAAEHAQDVLEVIESLEL